MVVPSVGSSAGAFSGTAVDMDDDNSLFPLVIPPSSTPGIVASFESTCVCAVSSSAVVVVVAAAAAAVVLLVVVVVAVVAGVVVGSKLPIYWTSAMLGSFNAYGMAAKNSRILSYAPTQLGSW